MYLWLWHLLWLNGVYSYGGYLITWGFSFHKAALKYQYRATTVPQYHPATVPTYCSTTVAYHYNTVPRSQYTRQLPSQCPLFFACLHLLYKPDVQTSWLAIHVQAHCIDQQPAYCVGLNILANTIQSHLYKPPNKPVSPKNCSFWLIIASIVYTPCIPCRYYVYTINSIEAV